MQSIDKQYLAGLPESFGCLMFRNGNNLLYVTESVNLRHTLSSLFFKRDEDNDVKELFETADILEMEKTSSGIEAIIRKKLLTEKESPSLNQRIQPWKNYVYLAVNPAEFPFVKITDYTEEDWFYVGPFKSRFFLMDVIELMHKLLKLPYCEVKSGPCEKLDNHTCRGWCELIRSESTITENEEVEHSEQPNLQKLDALLKEAFVHPDNMLLDLILKEKEKYENELQFNKAELLKTEIGLLKQYKDWLIFLYKIKTLNFVTDKLSIKTGQLVSFKIDGMEHHCPYLDIKYRPNEVLAINKNLVDEARIIYKEIV